MASYVSFLTTSFLRPLVPGFLLWSSAGFVVDGMWMPLEELFATAFLLVDDAEFLPEWRYLDRVSATMSYPCAFFSVIAE